MQTIETLFSDYASYHRTPGNKVFHRFGIPLIVLSMLGLMARISLFSVGGTSIDLGIAVIIAAEIAYLRLSWRLAIPMLIVVTAMWAAGRVLSMPILWTLFILGWILQFIGHYVHEKRQPAFYKNGMHLLIGPMWILNDVLPIVHTQAGVTPSTPS